MRWQAVVPCLGVATQSCTAPAPPPSTIANPCLYETDYTQSVYMLAPLPPLLLLPGSVGAAATALNSLQQAKHTLLVICPATTAVNDLVLGVLNSNGPPQPCAGLCSSNVAAVSVAWLQTSSKKREKGYSFVSYTDSASHAGPTCKRST